MGIAVFDSSPSEFDEIEFNRGVFFLDVILYVVSCMWSFFPEGLLEIFFGNLSLPSTEEGVVLSRGSHDED